jgi:hypothetical protein
MFSDDVYRKQLADTIDALSTWAHDNRDVAKVEITPKTTYWKMTVTPDVVGACPFELLLRADHRFNVAIGGEVYEDKPIDTFGFFTMLARAIGRGNVERIEVRNALTGTLEAVETRVTLEDGWAWIGERRTAPRGTRRLDVAEELRTQGYLPYRR